MAYTRRMTRQVSGKLLAGLLVAALVLLGVEVGLRLLLGPPPPPVRVFQVLGEVETYLKVDAQGLVSTQHQLQAAISPFPAKRPDSRARVAVLGGSSVHVGDGYVPYTSEFASLLSSGLGIYVYNLGAPGLDTFDHVSITEELSAVDLDAVIVYAGHNDLGNALFQERYGDAVGRLSVVLLPWLERSQLFSQLRRALLRPDGTSSSALQGRQKKTSGRAELDTERRAVAARYYAANLERIRWLCRQQGKALILVVPVSDLSRQMSPIPCEEGRPCASTLWWQGQQLAFRDPQGAAALLRQARDADIISMRTSSEMEATVRAFAGKAGVSVVDAPALLPRQPGIDAPASMLFNDTIHFSVQGHQAMAQAIAPTLQQVLQAR